MIEVKNKRGLSPIIATVLLIAISLSLAVIIFVWAYDFFGESIQKQGRTIEQSCEDVRFDAEINSGILSVINSGDIPLQGVEIKKKNLIGGDLTGVKDFDTSIGIGETESFSVNEIAGDIAESDEIIISPVLLGEDEANLKKYICGEDFAKVISM